MRSGEQAQRGHITLAEVIPVRDVAVKVRGSEVREAHDRKGNRLIIRRDGEVTTIALPVLEQYEAVMLRMA